MTDDGGRDGERGEPDHPDRQEASLVPADVTRPRSSGLFDGRWGRGRRKASAAGTTDSSALAGGPDRPGRMRTFLGFVTERVVEAAPRIPVRDLQTLRKQFPGLGPEEIADKLVAGAARSSATVGAGVGAAAMMPVPPAMPAELAAEVVGVASVEIKLIAELHEVYGRRPAGSTTQRAAAYLGSWTSERGIDVIRPTTLNAALGGGLRREIRQQLLKRTVRNLPNLAPLMIGAVTGAVMNRRDTKKIAEKIRADLRGRGDSPLLWSQLPEQNGPDAGLPPAP